MKKRLVVSSAEGPDGVRFSADTRGGIWVAARTATGALACVQVSAADWVAMLEGIRVEDVPDPKTAGQVLYEAQGAEVCPFTVNWRPWEDLSDAEKDYRERVARRLGIKPEGE